MPDLHEKTFEDKFVEICDEYLNEFYTPHIRTLSVLSNALINDAVHKAKMAAEAPPSDEFYFDNLAFEYSKIIDFFTLIVALRRSIDKPKS